MQNEISSLLQKNLSQVWGERDAAKRLETIELLYAPEAGLYHVGHETKGHEAINYSVTGVLSSFPTEFSFFLLKPIVVNNNMATAHWGVGPNLQSIAATGMDVVLIAGGKIESLYVFLD